MTCCSFCFLLILFFFQTYTLFNYYIKIQGCAAHFLLCFLYAELRASFSPPDSTESNAQSATSVSARTTLWCALALRCITWSVSGAWRAAGSWSRAMSLLCGRTAYSAEPITTWWREPAWRPGSRSAPCTRPGPYRWQVNLFILALRRQEWHDFQRIMFLTSLLQCTSLRSMCLSV